MGISAGVAYVDIIPNLDKFQSGLQSAGKKFSAIGRKLSTNLTLPIIGLGTAAFKAFADAEKVSAQVAAGIKSTGGAANITAEQVDALATSISNMSGIDDEAIKTSQSMLLTFTNIRNEVGKGNNIFDQATLAVANLSTRMEGDLKGASIQVGKALNDPLKGITALGRAGVQFTDAQKKQIKTLVASGKTMKAQKVILKELTKQFGGSAKAFGKTEAGRIAKMKVAIGNLGEAFGQALLPFVKKATKALGQMVEWFKNLSPQTRDLIVKIALLAAALGPLFLILGKLVGIIRIVVITFQLLAANPVILVVAAIIAAIVLLILNWKKVTAFLGKVWTSIKNGALGVIDFFAKMPGRILAFLMALPGRMLAMGGRLIGGLKDGIVGWWKTKLVPWFAALPGKILAFFADCGNWLIDVGRSIIGGLIKGMTFGLADGSLDSAIDAAAARLGGLRGSSTPNTGGGSREPSIPPTAKGGIVTQPQVRLVGEAGPEAIIPLSKLGAMMGGQRITGRLELRGGEAYIYGVAEGALDDDADLAGAHGRMRR